MASNVQLSTNVGDGAKLVTKQITHDGDTAQLQAISFGIVTGTEDNYTFTDSPGGAGAVTAGTTRMTLASDDPAVVDLAAIEVLLTGIDVDTNAIKTDAAALEVLATSIDGKITACNTGAVTVTASALPTGAATEATLAAIAGYIDTEIQAIVTAIQLLDNAIAGNEVQVDVLSSALPTGASTLAEQQTQTGHLATIAGDTTSLDGKITACNTGAVVIASGTITTVTTVATVTNLAQLGGQAVSMGTGVRDAGTQRVTIATNDSVPVTGTFWQATQPISAASLPLPTGAALETGGNLAAIATDAAAIEVLLRGGLPAALGAGGGLKIDSSGMSLPVSGTLTGITNAVTINGGAGQTSDIKVTLDSETVVLGAGTAEIGKLAAGGVDIGDVDVTSIAAGTNTIGGVIGQASSSVVYDGTTACTVKRFSVVTTATGAVVIAAPSGTKKIRVLSMSIIALSATNSNIHLETGTSNTDCLGTGDNPIPVAMDADGNNTAGIVLPWNPGGWFQTADADEALEVVMSSNQAMLFVGNYIEVT